MTKKIKNIIVAFVSLSLALTPLAMMSTMAVAAAQADITTNLCKGVDLDPNSAGQDCNNTTTGNLSGILSTAINIFSLVVGVIAVIMIIVGGLRYITSGGDSGKVGAAKTTIIYALVGLVVVALAQLIVRFVLTQANNIVTSA
jgi:cytochrome bd-type quinol oxidase subunit 2